MIYFTICLSTDAEHGLRLNSRSEIPDKTCVQLKQKGSGFPGLLFDALR